MDFKEYLLSHVMQEAGEAAQAGSKCQLFGLNDVNPNLGQTNRESLIDEVNDLISSMDQLAQAGYIPKDWQSPERQALKATKMHYYKYRSVKLECLPLSHVPYVPVVGRELTKDNIIVHNTGDTSLPDLGEFKVLGVSDTLAVIEHTDGRLARLYYDLGIVWEEDWSGCDYPQTPHTPTLPQHWSKSIQLEKTK